MGNKITYIQQGDYLLPDLRLPEQPNVKIGIWGQRHKNYLLHHHKIRYYNLLTSCKLIDYLTDINEQAEVMYENLVIQLTKQKDIAEQLKECNPMLWVQKMNIIGNLATEIVNTELIFV